MGAVAAPAWRKCTPRAAAACALAALLVAGCSEGSSGPGDPQPLSLTFTPATQLSGSTVRTSSGAFAAALPTVITGARTLAVSRLDDTTVSIVLPDTTSVDLALSVDAGAGGLGAGVVHVRGFDHATQVPGALWFDPLAITVNASPRFLAQGQLAFRSYVLGVLDPATEQLTTITGLEAPSYDFGIVPSRADGEYILRDSTDRLGRWRLFPTPQLLDTVPLAYAGARLYAQLADSVWMTLSSTMATRRTPTSTTIEALFSDPLRVVFSPARDRFVVIVPHVAGGLIPMFGGLGDTLYTFPGASLDGAAFSWAGDTLFYSTKAAGGSPARIVARATATGDSLLATPLPAGFHGYGLALDPARPALYQVADSSGVAALLVWDPGTLTLMGRMTAGFSNAGSWSAGILVDTVPNRVFVAYPGAPPTLAVYSRFP